MSRLTSKAEFQRLRGLLQASTGRDFERLIIPLVRFLVPSAFGAPALGDFDKLGIDLLAWKATKRLKLVVQCKAFKAHEQELGPDQISQCVESIAKFAASGYEADLYLLIHNRLGKSESFRTQVTQHIRSLTASGQCRRAELWSCDKLMAAMAKAVRHRMLTSVQGASSLREDHRPDDIVEVPFKASTSIVDRHQLKMTSEGKEQIADPTKEILAIGRGRDARAVLLGEAGFGKTTAVMRAAQSTQCRVFFMRAAALVEKPTTRHTLIEQFPFIEELLADIPAEDIPTIEPLLRASTESVFSIPDVRAMLIIDGLDESMTLTRRGGLQWLFNAVEAYTIPVLMTCRTEFWRSRAADFATSLGVRSPKPGTAQRDTQLRVIELLPWTDEQILLLTSQYMATLVDPIEKGRVAEFSRLVERQKYSSLYGDIPRRPLFLRFILETVSRSGTHEVNQLKLLEEWANMKIVRDYMEPMKYGPGRQGITDQATMTVTLDLACRAMMRAASLMTEVHDGKLALAPTCRVEDIAAAEKWLSGLADPLGLFLNTLLIPIDGSGLSTIVRFGHQVYQEFFLAKFIAAHPDHFERIAIPADVHQWIDGATATRLAVIRA